MPEDMSSCDLGRDPSLSPNPTVTRGGLCRGSASGSSHLSLRPARSACCALPLPGVHRVAWGVSLLRGSWCELAEMAPGTGLVVVVLLFGEAMLLFTLKTHTLFCAVVFFSPWNNFLNSKTGLTAVAFLFH